jgi:hypothetical protein
MADATARVANPVYGEQKPNFRSQHIYFYYLTPGHGRRHITAYYFNEQAPLTPAEMQLHVKTLVHRIRNANPPLPKAFGFRAFPWRHKSYFVAVYDHHERLTKDNAVTFTYEATGGPNHSFFGGVDIAEVEPNLSGFFCVNHMRGVHGNDLRNGEREKFVVTANHPDHAHFLVRALRFLGHFRSHTDSGTNTGPPQP